MTTLQLGSRIGKFPYYVQDRLNTGQGAMSEVYLATVGRPTPETLRQPQVVLKIARILDQHGEFYHAALDNEVERLRRLKHPGIVRLFPIQFEGMRTLPYMAQSHLDGKPWFSVMEYLSGGSVADLVEKCQQVEIGLALEIVRSLSATLDYLHSRGQVHLDIKPENILFRSDPTQNRVEPVLIDFGVARDFGQSGLKAGTIQYSPPERLQATKGIQPPELAVPPHSSMDIYSLGLVLYYMIAGRLPFQGPNRESITSAILEGNPTVPSKYKAALVPELDELILLTINKDPQKRPSAEELTVALEATTIKLGYTPIGIHESRPLPARPVQRPSNIRKLVPFGMLGLISILLIFIVSFTDWQRVNALVIGGESDQATVDTLIGALTATPEATATTAQAAEAPTSTPASAIDLPSATQTVASQSQPTATAEITPTPRSTTALIVPTRGPTPTSTLRAVSSVSSVRLITPADQASSNAIVTFEWQPNGLLPRDHAFELIFWKQGQDEMTDGFGLHGPTDQTSLSINVSRLAATTLSNKITISEPYRWGIRLLRCENQLTNCTPVRFLGSSRQFTPK